MKKKNPIYRILKILAFPIYYWKWSELTIYNHNIVVFWDWCNSFYGEDYDDGVSSSLFQLNPKWWKKDFFTALDDIRCSVKCIMIPSFLCYIIFLIPTIKDAIKWHNKKQDLNPMWTYDYSKCLNEDGSIKE